MRRAVTDKIVATLHTFQEGTLVLREACTQKEYFPMLKPFSYEEIIAIPLNHSHTKKSLLYHCAHHGW
jgi:hypothetical protein